MTGEARPLVDPSVLIEDMQQCGWVLDSLTPVYARMKWPPSIQILITDQDRLIYVPIDPAHPEYQREMDHLMEIFASIATAHRMIKELSAIAEQRGYEAQKVRFDG